MHDFPAEINHTVHGSLHQVFVPPVLILRPRPLRHPGQTPLLLQQQLPLLLLDTCWAANEWTKLDFNIGKVVEKNGD